MPPRKLAVFVWVVLVALLLLFLGMVLAVEEKGAASASRTLLFWVAVASSALGIALSRVLPWRIPSHQAGGAPPANAFVRFLAAWAPCEAAAIYPLVVHLLARDSRLLVVFAVDVLALLTLYPSPNAWARFSAEGAPGPRGRR